MNEKNETVGSRGLTRRGMLKGVAGAAAAAAILPGCGPTQGVKLKGKVATKGRIKQSVCQWCFDKMPLEALAKECADMGLKSIELVPPKDWPILKKHGLVCALTASHGFTNGLNDPKYHAMCIEKIRKGIDASAEAGWPNVITFSGSRRKGMTDEEGIDNTVTAVKKIIGHAEKKKVNLCLEILNSRVAVEMKGHPGYMADNVEWIVKVCDKVGSERMKILFDIYHVQVMQGDVIARIRQYKDYIGHYHTAGVPGRNELDDTQELNWPPIMREILATGYTGYVAQEFMPTRDPMRSLREAVALCDV